MIKIRALESKFMTLVESARIIELKWITRSLNFLGIFLAYQLTSITLCNFVIILLLALRFSDEEIKVEKVNVEKKILHC